MLGWEFPPFITGGLGTACHGLTRALDAKGVDVTFVLPKGVAGEHASHVRLVAPGLNTEGPELRTAAGATAPGGIDRRKVDRGVGARTVAGQAMPTPRPRPHAAAAGPDHRDAPALPERLGRAIRMVAAPFVGSGAYGSPAARAFLAPDARQRRRAAAAAPRHPGR